MKDDSTLLDSPAQAPARPRPAPRTSARLRTAGATESDYYSEERHGPHEYFELGNFELESGDTLPNVSAGDDVSFVIADEGKAYLIPTR